MNMHRKARNTLPRPTDLSFDENGSSVASDDENVVAHAEWVHEWCRTQSSEEIFARTVQKWDEFMPTPTPDFWFLEKGTVEDARKIKFDNDN